MIISSLGSLYILDRFYRYFERRCCSLVETGNINGYKTPNFQSTLEQRWLSVVIRCDFAVTFAPRLKRNFVDLNISLCRWPTMISSFSVLIEKQLNALPYSIPLNSFQSNSFPMKGFHIEAIHESLSLQL